MKQLKLLIMAILVSFSTVSNVWAALEATPESCPKVEVIKQAGLFGVQEDKKDQMYFAYQIGKYSTPSTWAFVVGVPMDQATSSKDAMNKAKEALLTLAGDPEPIAMDDTNKRWYCLYKNDFQYLTASVTPLSISNELVDSTLKFQKMQLKK